tara:strand:- start:86 stop:571 length:486 start_codon:yes stop_codon:yes gene_type:complete
MGDLIFDDGFRANVGIVIFNQKQQVFFAKRRYQSGWQFPQGGIQLGESPKKAMFRELLEETGLDKKSVEVTYVSDHWYDYRIPKKSIRKATNGTTVIGQRQKWFLLKLKDQSTSIVLNSSSEQEFDSWKWIAPDLSIKQVIGFKQEVYKKVISEFIPFIEA